MHPVFITVSFAQSQSAPNAGVCCRDETRRANLFASLGHVSDASVFVSPSLSLLPSLLLTAGNFLILNNAQRKRGESNVR